MMHAVTFCLILALLCIQNAVAYLPVKYISKFSRSKIQSTALFAAANNKKEPTPEQSQYWQGDWVCADCGYVYDRDIDGGGLYFEQQKRGFICPQCSAPRKRYAKKVGDVWGVTRDGGDLPIYAFSFLGIAATAWFALVYVPTM